MKKTVLLLAVILCAALTHAQHTFQATIKDAKTNQPLAGASVKLPQLAKGTVSDSTGTIILTNLPAGKQIIQFSFIGYEKRTDTLSFPLSQPLPLIILLNPHEEEELEEVVVSATRSSRTIDNIPTRIEVLAGEEIDEKANMKPGDIRMMLAETTGIQTQQTSATSANSSIRIQGLDGKYTQIIRDGFPLYSGFSGGLGLLQIAPLDLKQVEVIKGSSSTLYGGGAIAGLVNLVSKTPTEKRQLSFLLNGTSAMGLDVSGFYGQKFKKIGTTVYAAYNHGSAYDPVNIGLTAIPKFDRFTLNPKVYFYLSDQTTLITGLNATIEKRIGGDMEYIKGNESTNHSYFEENKTDRYSSQLELKHQLNGQQKLTFRNSLSYYNRSIALPNYLFSGVQLASYSEANYAKDGETADWVVGLNYLTEDFEEDKQNIIPLRSYQNNTIGAFIQNTFMATAQLTFETGLRGDYHSDYGFFMLPKVSILWKMNREFTFRLGGGMGYKAPSVFTEDAERIQFRNVLPVDVNETSAERSYGTNFDINYKTPLFNDQVGFSINQLFFYTRINNPILLNNVSGYLTYQQPKGDLNTKGIETNIKLTFKDFKLFVGYTFADVTQHTGNNFFAYSLVSKHRLNNVLMYEVEDQWKIGAEAYYFSTQQLNDGTIGKSYWTPGLMIEKLWERCSIFINFENFIDTRQTKFDSIYSGPITNPVFRDIYAPVDGFVMNGGIKIRL
ncbi:TonB-dependent receptor [Pedobacter insulae]|uniref:Iron complex outermembrane recepter protein n=1 Tax=Pedobacter insulae TaxID=414048 RepID=A0A1I2ZA43_9SPHI|nr:TonB-dependent receptor [Pedobacter insulae]SFH34717.1 iron complex outermembrane recepter protein [Pedobacter insulae]